MSENGERNRPFIDRRQLAPHGALQKSAGRTRPRRDEAWGMTRSRSGAVETHPPKSPPKRALYRWGAYDGGAATWRLRRGSSGRSLVIVLRSNPTRKCSLFAPRNGTTDR